MPIRISEADRLTFAGSVRLHLVNAASNEELKLSAGAAAVKPPNNVQPEPKYPRLNGPQLSSEALCASNVYGRH